jgi:hypothetical protein
MSKAKTATIPHKRQDCVDLRVAGKHVAYSCYFHAASVIADIQEGDDTVMVEQWGIPKAFDKGIQCCKGE